MVVAMEPGLEHPHAVQVDDGGAVNAEEVPRVESQLQRADGLPEQVGVLSRVDVDVLGLGFDPVDLFDPKQDDPTARSDDDAVQVGPARAQRLEQRQGLPAGLGAPVASQALLGPLKGGLEPGPVERLQ